MAGKRKFMLQQVGARKKSNFVRLKARTVGRAKAPGATRGFFGAQGRLKRQLQGIMERKVVDTASTTYVCDTTGTVTLLNGTAQGSDFSNRIGRKATMVAVQLEGQIIPADLTNTASSKCRVMLIYDAQPNGALPAITDILTASTSNAFMNLNNRDRFKVIADVNESIGHVVDTATQAQAGSPTVHNVSVYKKINLETIYDGTTAAIADVQTGALLLVTIGNQAAGAGGLYFGAVRVRFIDA